MKPSTSELNVVFASLLALAFDAGAADRWSAQIHGTAPHEMRLVGASPDEDGTLVLSLHQRAPSNVYAWKARIDEEGNLIDIDRNDEHRFPYRRHGTQWSQFHVHGGGLEINNTLNPFSCTRERDWLGAGSDYRRFTSEIRPQVGFGEDIGRLDGEGGHFGTYALQNSGNPPIYTARFARDCSRVEVLDAGVQGLRNVPNAMAAYGWLDGKLVRVESTGVVWARSIARPTGEWAGRVGGVTDDGDAIVIFSTFAPPFKHIAINIDPLGTERWRRDIDGGEEIHVASEPDVTWLWTSDMAHEWAQPSGPHALIAIADSGSNVSQRELGAARLARLPHGGADSPSSWALMPAGPDDSRYAVLEAHSGNVQEVVRTLHRPLARFASGSIAAAGPGDQRGAFELRVISTSGAERTVALPSAARIDLADVAGDALGSLVLTYTSEKAATVTAHANDGAVQWTSRLPDVDGAPPPEFAFSAPQVRADATRVCVLWHRRFACLQRADGELRHAWTVLPEGTVNAFLLPLEENESRVLSTHCDRGPPNCAMQTKGYRFDTRGSMIGATTVPGYWSDHELIVGHDGAVGWYLYQDSTTQITVLDAHLRLAWTAQIARQGTLAALGANGTAYVGTETELIKHAADGGVLWRRPWPEGIVAWRASGIELPGGDVIVSTGESPLHRVRLRGADGEILWHHSGIENGWFTGPPFDWVLSSSGDRVFRQPRANASDSTWPSGQRALAIDIASGELLAAQAAPEIAKITDEKRFEAQVLSDGSVVRAVDDSSHGAVLTTRSFADLTASPSQRVDSSLLGAWQSPDTSGQGLFLDADGARAYGGWFTYTREGGHAPEALQWYTLVQPRASSGGVVDFDVYASRNGTFGQGAAVSTKAGSARLRRIHCDRTMLAYRFDTGLEGVIPLVRAMPASRDCGSSGEALGTPADVDPRSSGAWYDPAASGQGLAFDVTTTFFAGAWFTFAPSGGLPHWFTLSGTITPANGVFEVPIFRTMGGRFDAVPTNNTERVGTATLTFSGCESLALDYAFDDSDVAQAFRGRRGRIAMQRVSPCLD